MRDWQKVYHDNLGYRAEIIRSILENNGLNPVLLSKKDSSIQFGHYEVLVSPEHVIKALKLINEDIKFE